MPAVEHAPHNAMWEAGEVERFFDSATPLMRALLGELATAPDRPRTFPDVEDALGWPRRRIASVLGGVSHMRHTEFAGRRPYHFHDERQAASGRWEIWMDAAQAAAITAPPKDHGRAAEGRRVAGPPTRIPTGRGRSPR